MRIFLAIFLAAILVFIAVQAYNLRQQSADFSAKTVELNAEASALKTENQEYQRNIEYYGQPENLGKEALKYNRKKPGEQLYILVPPQGSTTPAGHN